MSNISNGALALLDSFGGAVPPCPSDLDAPQIWRLDLSGEWVEYPNDEGDIYTALFQFSNRHEFGVGKPVGGGFVVRTIGWGAPLDENGGVGDVPPSKHPLRHRISLDVCASPSGAVASRMCFQSGEKAGEVIDDNGEATGSLAQAVDLAAFRVWGSAFTSALLLDYADNAQTKTDKEMEHLSHRVARFLDVIEGVEE